MARALLDEPTIDGAGGHVSFAALMFHNIAAKRLRTALTALAIAIGVATGVTLGIVTHSLRTTAISILQIGRADFSISQKGVSDLLSSVLDQEEVDRVASAPDVISSVGVLVAPVRLDADHPLFLEIGLPPADLAEFGVRVVDGRAYAADATDEIMLGYRAARNLDKQVGDTIVIEDDPYRIVGLYATGQTFGDAASMLPLTYLQSYERKPSEVTLAFVRLRPGASVDAVRKRIERDNPELVTVRTAEEFGRADRNLQLISAADRAATIVALTVGSIIVANVVLLSFLERIREFGLLRSIGWSRRRLALLVIGEVLIIGLIGAAVGVGLSYVGVRVLTRVSDLRGILQPSYTSDVFARALYTASGMALFGALYPAIRAAMLIPLEALRRE